MARNRGAGNGGLFIDLIAAAPRSEAGPNSGIEPPTFSTATQASAGGSGAEAGATVRVFRKQTAAAGELESFLGEAIADADGNWKVDLRRARFRRARSSLPRRRRTGGDVGAGHRDDLPARGRREGGEVWRRQRQRDVFGDRAPGLLASDAALSGPRRRSSRREEELPQPHRRFAFKADEAGSSFLCKLDDKPFDLCRSPKRYVGLEPGKHVF